MPIILNGNDEITSLSRNLNELYANLRENYKELEDNNTTLAIENERQEVFLRAFSHQLKTPISAALLLVQGMYEEIGKYKDTKVYLPKVKEQLISMQKIVEDIIYLNHCTDNTRMEPQALDIIINASLSGLEISLAEKSLTVEAEGTMGIIETEGEMMKILIDNLLSNAVNHSPDHGLIRIVKSAKSLQIINYHCQIPEDILPHIFEPFVTSNHKQKGHGLGLYIVRYYSQFLKCQVSVRNITDGVETSVTLE
jgi:signal transduction histidine kinase